MSDMLQITAECAYVTTDTASGRTRVLMYKGAIIPADTPEAKHLLDSGMAVPVGGEVSGGLNADGEPDAAAAGAAPKTGEAPRDTPKGTAKRGGKDDELAALREQAVAAGMDRAEVEKASAEDLRAVLGK